MERLHGIESDLYELLQYPWLLVRNGDVRAAQVGLQLGWRTWQLEQIGTMHAVIGQVFEDEGLALQDLQGSDNSAGRASSVGR